MPHTARSSSDSVFRKRSRANTDNDPTGDLAKLQALRAEFNAREEAKERRIHEGEEKAREKNARKKAKQDEAMRRKFEAHEKKYGRSNVTSEKSVPFSMGYADTAPVPMDIDLESSAPTLGPPRRGRTVTAGSATKAVASRWSLFWFKFKTMWLKIKKSMSMRS